MVQTFKILSLDGGGIRGLYTAKLLANFEKKYNCKIRDKFDMICGTSIGSILAIALSLGIPAIEIANLYEQNGAKILSDGKFFNRLWLSFKQYFFQGKYGASLGEYVRDIIGDGYMNTCNNIVCIPTFDMVSGEPVIFKNGDKIKMVDAILASSAAPTYFPMHKIKKGCYVDGGLWANNPSLYASFECLEQYIGEGKQYDKYAILSIPPTNIKYHVLKNIDTTRSFIDWGSQLFDVMMESQLDSTNLYCKKLANITGNNYYRFNSSPVPEKYKGIITMDNASEEALHILTSLAEYDSKLLNEENKYMIEYFFK